MSFLRKLFSGAPEAPADLAPEIDAALRALLTNPDEITVSIRDPGAVAQWQADFLRETDRVLHRVQEFDPAAELLYTGPPEGGLAGVYRRLELWNLIVDLDPAIRTPRRLALYRDATEWVRDRAAFLIALGEQGPPAFDRALAAWPGPPAPLAFSLDIDWRSVRARLDRERDEDDDLENFDDEDDD
jgi:hypothetical protein